MALELKDIFASKGMWCREKQEQTAVDQTAVVGTETRQRSQPWLGGFAAQGVGESR